ncbi:membrane hypothetical protein [uncultured Desulfovibrio sp.]|uniref:Uncharacterized protein n=1 Tax=uncultured Desulfovibrio sp. TaxID=167968 RepID=A0A212JF38_9BACT|nr:membrane hypothetical protein [uncultured Desulfovibrio sp.]
MQRIKAPCGAFMQYRNTVAGVSLLLLGGFAGAGGHMAGTAALELGAVLGGIFLSLLRVAAVAGAVAILGVEGHEHAHGVTFARTRGGVAFGTGYVTAVAPHFVVAVHAVDAFVRRMGEHDAHTRGCSTRNFNGLFNDLRHFLDITRLRFANPHEA